MPEPLSSLKTTAQERYGFLDMYTGYFQHVGHTENEVNELGTDAETCSPAERRTRRLKHEDEKWDEEHYMCVQRIIYITPTHVLTFPRADFADDDYIQELIHWTHPHIAIQTDFAYTEEENLVMLRLPRKECLFISIFQPPFFFRRLP